MTQDTITHPFDTPGDFVVLENTAQQRCVWPVFADVPGGWQVAHGPVERKDALTWIEAHDPGLMPR